MQIETTSTAFNPFLKWPGGKRWFVNYHSDLFPNTYSRYIEPFLGGGAIFFHLRPSTALIGDINPDIIAAYEGLKCNWQFIKRSLNYHKRLHSDDYYYKVRNDEPKDQLQRASRMIYLNRTCFNGIYRVNLSGKFNVPRGSKNNVVLDTDDFEGVSKILQNATILLADFEKLIDEAKENDLIFADPPYTVRHNLNGFVRYNETLFSWQDQERLAKALIRAQKRGVKIISTNANHSSIRELYEEKGFCLKTVTRFSSISATSISRRQFEELVILSNINILNNGNTNTE